MNKEHLNSIAEALGEIYQEMQNRAITEVTKQLSSDKNSQNIKEWKRKQNNAINSLKNKILRSISPLKKMLITSNHNAMKLTLKNSLRGDKIKASEELEKKTLKKADKEMDEKALGSVSILINSSLSMFRRSVKVISSKTYSLGLEGLTKEIEKTINAVGGVENAPKVAYRNADGSVVRNVKWSSWMEMNVRTTISERATDFQYKVSRDNGIVFYLCNYFSNCALDHAKFQGKIYVDKSAVRHIKDEEEKKQVIAYVREHKCLDINDVMNNKPYLTTRPNCRHKFKPMLTQEVLHTSVKKMLVDNNMKSGKYDKKQYEMLQRQRLNERTIRKYKERKDNNEILLKNAKTPEDKKYIQNQIAKDKKLITKWQKKNNALVKANPNLERDYRRESYKILVKDLGVKYNS